ncbi:glycosyltransferase [Euzebya tangerina]|uniref:glycosyltransferase n=1 Tax=Euzebya tangerina TaxID=591198 RepID=UPI000E318046|nr:glycosyltransferase [Euzebya tangerina]
MDGHDTTLSVLHLIARLPPSGTERQLVGMAKAAVDQGLWNPTVGVLYEGFPLTRELSDAGIPVVEFGAEPSWHPGRAAGLLRHLRTSKPDVLHTSLWGGSLFGRAVAALDRERPAIVMSERRVEHFRSPAKRALDRPLRLLTEAYIGNSGDVAQFIATSHGVSPRRVVVIPNGIDTTTFRPRTSPPSTADSSGPIRVGAVGRLVHQKGFDVLLHALPLVLERRPATLSIVGDGPLRRELESQAEGLPVEFLGALDTPDQVADFLHDLTVFAMPSRYEGLPNALLEAQACRIPAVATDAPGLPPAAGPGVRLCRPEDPHSLADAILEQAEVSIAPSHPDLRTFADVAQDHRDVFVRARRSRNWKATRDDPSTPHRIHRPAWSPSHVWRNRTSRRRAGLTSG